MSNNSRRNIFNKLSLKKSQSIPIITNNKNHIYSINSKSIENLHTPIKTNSSSVSNIKSAILINDRITLEESQQHLNDMHKIVDQTDNDLRHALEHAAIRREQLDDLHFRSEEMLSKNENLVFGITNYRKTQERDIFWRRFRYIAFGTITISIIILLIILSMTNKRSNSSSQVINIRHINQDLSKKDITWTMMMLTTSQQRRRKKEILTELNEFLSSKSKYFFLTDNNL